MENKAKTEHVKAMIHPGPSLAILMTVLYQFSAFPILLVVKALSNGRSILASAKLWHDIKLVMSIPPFESKIL